ncbi:MAG: polyprenyl synthetase family protein [Wenzhouxiangellaceae bacterium]|nr:polyprenyl synthetase family protein [Wenzhouxiangellaceae bacterium]
MPAGAAARAETSRASAVPCDLSVDRLQQGFEQQLAATAARVCGHDESCPQLAAAMRYSLLAPGKRVRPMLALLTAVDLGADPGSLMPFAVALEMVHCASLMLDDLPCMDNATQRRGRPAAHVKFGEAVTTLAAVGLLGHASGELAHAERMECALRTELIAQLSAAVGTAGLVSGQSRDLGERRDEISDGQLARIHRQKTAVLFELAVVGAGLHAGLGELRLERLKRFARQVGMAFQTADDLLDCKRLAHDSGKDSDCDRAKAGSVHRLGAPALRARLDDELAAAEREMQRLEMRGRGLADYVRALFQRHLD